MHLTERDINFAIEMLSHPQQGDASDIKEAFRIAIESLKAWKEILEEAVRTKDIEDLPSVTPQSRWVPVSERLPEEEGLYLVTVKNEHDRRYSKTCWFHGDGNWFARQDVIAWMPLPASYEPKESEEKK